MPAWTTTSAPTPEPTPQPTPEPTPRRITVEQLDEGTFDDYFDDAVFVGDSVTKCLSGYVQKMRVKDKTFLGKARFLGAVSMTLWIASRNEPAFSYRGASVSVTGGISQMGAQKAFILLGGNDVWIREWSEVEGLYVDLIRLIRNSCPDVQIIVQGILPVSRAYCQNHSIPIERWNAFNQVLERMCAEQGVEYLYFGQMLMDAEGYLDPACAEGDVHPNDVGDAIWVRALRAYAARQMEPDAVVLYPSEEAMDGH